MKNTTDNNLILVKPGTYLTMPGGEGSPLIKIEKPKYGLVVQKIHDYHNNKHQKFCNVLVDEKMIIVWNDES